MNKVQHEEQRVHSRIGVDGLGKRHMGGTIAGMRAAARHEHRLQVRRVAAVISVLGFGENVASRLVTVSWAALALGTVLGAQAPPLRMVVPPSIGWLTPTVLLVVMCVLGVGFARHLIQIERSHRTLLGAVPASTRRGLVAGLSLSYVPAVVVTASQMARGGLLDLPSSLGTVVASMLDLAATDSSTSRWLTAACVVLATGLATSRASQWIGAHGFGPRVPAAHRWAGRTVSLLLAIGWIAANFLESGGRFAMLGQHSLVAVVLVSTLILRARHIRFVSPETFGYGLRLASQAGADPRRLAALSRRNAVLMLVPGYVGAALLLVLHANPFTVVLLVALAIFEFALAEFVVQRSTVLLPASGLSNLTSESRSAFAAAACLGVVFTTTGSGGLFAVFDFAAHRTTVVAASVLLISCAVTISWLVRTDTPRWLSDLRATSRNAS